MHDVEGPHLEIAWDALHEVGVEVGGKDVSARPDLLRQPLREGTVARADLQAAPAFGQASALEMKLAPRIEQAGHKAKACGFARDHAARYRVDMGLLARLPA
jgi:hypothetical protein